MMIATLLESTPFGLMSAMKSFDPAADAFEVRFDMLEQSLDPVEVRKRTNKTLVATCRRPSDGGKWKGEEHDRLRLLEGALQAGFDFVDLEGPTQLPVAEERVIRSLHDLQRTPPLDELERRGKELGRAGAHVKIACRVRNFADALTLYEFTRRLRGVGLDASVMGLGAYSRPVGYLLGSKFTYGGARNLIPGQQGLKDIRRDLDHWGNPSPARDLHLVVGTPIQHSLSPRLHNAAFRALGMSAAYGALEVHTDRELAALLAAAPALGIRGLSVTAPLKEAAWRNVGRSTPEARASKSVNCVRWEAGMAVGHNTDGIGAQNIIRRLLPSKKADPRMLLLGTGGAARGILGTVKGTEFIVAGRDRAKLRGIENEYGVGTVGLELAHGYFPSYDLIVNATSVQEPVRLSGFRGAVFDLHYGSEPTAWERQAKELGLPFAGGKDLLIEQAIPAFEFWTGKRPERAVFDRALEGAP